MLPIVLTGRLKNLTRRIPTITAMSEPGILLLINGQTIRIARLTRPITSAHTLRVLALRMMALILSTVSIVTVPSG